MNGNPGVRRWVAAVVVGVCVVVAVAAPDPDRYQRSLVGLHDFLHVPGFAVVVASLFFGLSRTPFALGGRRKRLILAFTGALTIGVAVELIQAMWGGDADPWDVVRDAVGAVTALLVIASAGRDLRLLRRWALRFAAMAVVAPFLVPTVAALVDEARARRQFPILADFRAPSELGRFAWSSWSSAVLERADGSGGGTPALHLSLSPGKYPGLTFKFFPRDWRGWREFVVVCTNPGAAPFPITIRIDDIAHNHDYSDRYNRTFGLTPGRNEIRIPLSDVQSAPRDRKLDLARVSSVILFAYELREPRTLLIHEFRLAR